MSFSTKKSNAIKACLFKTHTWNKRTFPFSYPLISVLFVGDQLAFARFSTLKCVLRF